MIGLTGPHRVGKSTLAQAFAEKHGMVYVRTGASATYERLGFSPKVDYPFDVRLMIQKEILRDCEALYRASGFQWITDRTPIDFMAYLLADIQRQNVPLELAGEVTEYIAECYEVVEKHFSVIIAVQPGIELLEEEGKAPANIAYIEHLNMLTMGLITSEEMRVAHYYLPREMTSLDQRVSAVKNAFDKTATRFQNDRRDLTGSTLLH